MPAASLTDKVNGDYRQDFGTCLQTTDHITFVTLAPVFSVLGVWNR